MRIELSSDQNKHPKVWDCHVTRDKETMIEEFPVLVSVTRNNYGRQSLFTVYKCHWAHSINPDFIDFARLGFLGFLWFGEIIRTTQSAFFFCHGNQTWRRLATGRKHRKGSTKSTIVGDAREMERDTDEEKHRKINYNWEDHGKDM